MDEIGEEKFLRKMWNPLYSKLYSPVFGLLLLFATGIFFSCGNEKPMVKWQIDSIKEIGGNTVIVSGSPQVVSTENGDAVEFDGKSDGLLVKSNPISDWQNFVIEVDFKPYPGFPENVEQRFLHIQDPENENRRILIELRLNENNKWYGDWYLKTDYESLTLIDSTNTHPLNQWATISLKYKDGEVTGSVNGEVEVRGNIEFLPLANTAQTSIGTRMDQRSWFKGAIREVRFVKLDD